ncbi:MAG: LysM peptidoglycan-binding domain-containing protein, partial [Caldilinea sp.]
MNQSKWRLALTAALLTALLVTALAPAAFAAEQSAPAAQVRATEVSGTVPGGQFAKLWLGLEITNPGNFTVTATWDRLNPEQNGVGFYILDPGNVAAVSMGERIERNQLAMGDSNFFVAGDKNIQGASIRAVGTDYTIVVYNDSATDARFTLSVDNGIIVDNDNQVDAPAAATESTPASPEATATVATTTAATTTVATTTVATTTAATTAVAATTATTATVAAPAAAAPATTTAPAAGPFRSSSVKGELNEQYEQHYLGLEPEQRDSEITLRLSFDPRDNQELARRLNFWVLDEQGLVRYQSGENASDIAVANGNRVTTPGDENVRTTSFFAPGLGTYTVIVYNNSRIPATYELSATSAVLVDGSQQTTSAQEAAGSATTVAATTAAATAATTAGTTAATTAATPAAGSGAAGKPGGTYTVVSGDTLAIIARDIYGDYKLYEKLCAFNKLTDCNVIEVGQVINLPTREQIGAVATTTTAPATTPATTPA